MQSAAQTSVEYAPAASVAPNRAAVGPAPAARHGLLARLLASIDVRIAAGVFLLALVLRMLYVAWAPVFIGGDSLQYFQPVYDFLNGRGFTLTLKRPPLYSWLLYASQVTFGPSFVPVIVLQHVLGATVVALTYGIARLAWGPTSVAVGRWSGALAAILAAIAGSTMRWEHFLMTEAVYTFFNTTAVFLILLGLRRPAWWPWIGVGVAIGLGALTRSAGQAVLLVAPVMLLLVTRSWRQALGKSALALLAFGIVTVPWMARNYAVHGAFTTSGAAGQNLVTYTAIIHRGEFSFLDPLVVAVDDDPKMKEAREIIQQNMEDKISRPNKDVTGLGIFNRIRDQTRWSQTRADRAMRDIAIRAILSRPLVYARNTLDDTWEIASADDRSIDSTLRFQWDLWQSRNWRGPLARFIGPATPEQEASFDRIAAVDGLYHPKQLAIPLIVLFLVGTVLAALHRPWRPVLAVSFVVLGLLLVHAAVVGAVPRYRNPLDPLINVVALGALAIGVRWLLLRYRAARA